MNGRAMTVLYLDFLSCNMFTLDFNVGEEEEIVVLFKN